MAAILGLQKRSTQIFQGPTVVPRVWDVASSMSHAMTTCRSYRHTCTSCRSFTKKIVLVLFCIIFAHVCSFLYLYSITLLLSTIVVSSWRRWTHLVIDKDQYYHLVYSNNIPLKTWAQNGHRMCKGIMEEKHPCCTNLCSQILINASLILNGKLPLLKIYVTSEGAFSHGVLYYHQLSISRYQVSFYDNNYFE